ncbi:hypothetical protein EYF80_053816 [Liparis tanakae]|uniref:Uncharacterized protein n=1 Tax=Liparis tanakae TaxID=230148 RepID=A0A4Z2F588_9TELE|nr:hypothetical protein EYF80_053816 [Liparis tanakae]
MGCVPFVDACVAALPNLASAAGWLTISQLISLIGNQSAANGAGIKGAELQEKGDLNKYVGLRNLNLANAVSLVLGGKPTGDGQKPVTLEPNVGPPGTQRLEGMEPEPEEELMSSLGQILARIEAVGRAQAEDRRLFLESLQGPLVLRATPEPSEGPTSKTQEPSEVPTPEPSEVPTFEPSEVRIPEGQEPAELQNPEVQEPAELQNPEVQEPAQLQNPEVQEPAELQNPEVQEPVELPTTPVSRGPSAEGRPWFPVTRRRLLIPGARRRCPLPLPRLHPGQPQLPVPLPWRPGPVPTEPPRPAPAEPPPPGYPSAADC